VAGTDSPRWHAAWNDLVDNPSSPRSLSMSATVRLAAATLFTAGLAAAASTASAQEGPPGACACAVPAAPVAPAAALPTWGVGLHMTSLALAPEATPDAKTEYGGGGLQLRYRLAPRWQLELSIDHVQERLPDGSEGTHHLQSGTLAALYHFRPHARWDWYVLAGVGATGDGDPALSKEERQASETGHVHVGAGVERRFRHLGIAAEVRAVGMAPPDDAATKDGTVMPAGGDVPAMTVPAPEAGAKGTSGGMFTIAATYYF
jgi:hypothetical protein